MYHVRYTTHGTHGESVLVNPPRQPPFTHCQWVSRASVIVIVLPVEDRQQVEFHDLLMEAQHRGADGEFRPRYWATRCQSLRRQAVVGLRYALAPAQREAVQLGAGLSRMPLVFHFVTAFDSWGALEVSGC
jgi:hypothetical protein